MADEHEMGSILDVVHKSARELHEAGFIDKRRMAKLDALCLPEVPQYDAEQIRAIRDKTPMSQTVFAALLNTSPSTVRKWESGEKRPSAISCKLLNLLDRKGLEALL